MGVLGIDIGGTQMRVGLVESGRLTSPASAHMWAMRSR